MPKGSKTKAITAIGSEVTVTSQQSRFHVAANDAPNSKEVDVKDLSISVGEKRILERAALRIKEGVHYVLVGRNGTGKSTLLKALAENRIPDIPWNLRILLLGQSRTEFRDDGEGLGSASDNKNSEMVLEYVVRSNKRRQSILREADLLSSALDNTKDSLAAIKVLRQLNYEQSQRDLFQRQQADSQRTGARGLRARQTLRKMEEQVENYKQLAEQNDVQVDTANFQEEMNAATEYLDNLRLSLESMDASGADSKARIVLLGLGFSTTMIGQPVSALSGGWRTRCDLACALTQETDILLLDEPTNYLDLPAVIWLQYHITTNLPATSVVVVTHDRDFADAVGQELILLKLVPEHKLETFKGNLSAYENNRHQQIKRMTRMKQAQDKKNKHMEDTISSNIRSAKRTGDDKKLKQAASRRKKLEERNGLEISAKGTRFKLNRDLVGCHLTARADIEIPDMDPPVSIVLSAVPPSLRFPGPIVSFETVAYRYPEAKTSVLSSINLVIHPSDRIAIVGLNGAGKSTLIKLMAGSLNPGSGTATRHPRARISVFSQQAVEDLTELSLADPSLTALSYLLHNSASEDDEQLTESEARGILGELGLRGRVAADVPLQVLSGGQKVRVALAEVTRKRPHLLVLDEVTTHLDADTITALAEELESWKTALCVVSHDRWFIRRVIEGEKENNDNESDSDDEELQQTGVVYHLKAGKLVRLENGMKEYEENMERKIRKMKVKMRGMG
ncbi:MAG: hypothetical protein M1834_003268 [Cirrosporium novae-zelandiae]|nr:MAG: hypothetical protein M1834_003268 [Cirrosporium novae-zelandiae]